jgi:ubiquinone/menaquinone biosynthesis C-methylase UbiE
VTGKTENMPFKNESFDLILCLNMLDHVEDVEKSFSEIARVLKSKGYLLFNCDLRDVIDGCHPQTISKELISGFEKIYNLKVLSYEKGRRLGFETYTAIYQKEL